MFRLPLAAIALAFLAFTAPLLCGCGEVQKPYDGNYHTRAEFGRVEIGEVTIDGQQYIVAERIGGGVAICPKVKIVDADGKVQDVAELMRAMGHARE